MIDSLTFIVLLSFLVNILLGQECILPKQIIHFRLFKSHSHINGWNNGFYSIFRLNENIEFLYQGTFSGLGLVQVESHCLDSNANFLVSLSQPTISNDIEIGLEVCDRAFVNVGQVIAISIGGTNVCNVMTEKADYMTISDKRAHFEVLDELLDVSGSYVYIPSNSPTNSPLISTNPTSIPTLNIPSAVPTSTPSTSSPSNAPTSIPFNFPTNSPTNASPASTNLPTDSPTISPSSFLTGEPTFCPSLEPSYMPTVNPSNFPTLIPSYFPSTVITSNPSSYPSTEETNNPSTNPTINPSGSPIENPTIVPTRISTNSPTSISTGEPTFDPSLEPTYMPTINPSNFPTIIPSNFPSTVLTSNPSSYPSIEVSNNPSTNPTNNPSSFPTVYPTIVPTRISTNSPSNCPTTSPSIYSNIPTVKPSSLPTVKLTSYPTSNPTFQTFEFVVSYPVTQTLTTSNFLTNSMLNSTKSSLTTVLYEIFFSLNVSNIAIINLSQSMNPTRRLSIHRYLQSSNYLFVNYSLTFNVMNTSNEIQSYSNQLKLTISNVLNTSVSTGQFTDLLQSSNSTVLSTMIASIIPIVSSAIIESINSPTYSTGNPSEHSSTSFTFIIVIIISGIIGLFVISVSIYSYKRFFPTVDLSDKWYQIENNRREYSQKVLQNISTVEMVKEDDIDIYSVFSKDDNISYPPNVDSNSNNEVVSSSNSIHESNESVTFSNPLKVKNYRLKRRPPSPSEFI